MVTERDIKQVCNVVCQSFTAGGKLLLCGNGGSASDAAHIVGELGKSFLKKRSLSDSQREQLCVYGKEGIQLAERLQGGLPAIDLTAQISLLTAIVNDMGADLMFAQQVVAYGRAGDVLLGISTSGQSQNVIQAGITAKAMGLQTIGLTGETGEAMASVFDTMLFAKGKDTKSIQEEHSKIYHQFCAIIEAYFWEV